MAPFGITELRSPRDHLTSSRIRSLLPILGVGLLFVSHSANAMILVEENFSHPNVEGVKSWNMY